MPNYIPDGYYEPCYLAGSDRLWDPIRFERRPMLPAERSILGEAYRDAPPGQGEAIIARAMAERIRSWDLTVKRGDSTIPLPITAENILHLQPDLFDRLWMVVSGRLAPDADPKATAKDSARIGDALLESAITGRPAGDTQLEADQKNSEAP